MKIFDRNVELQVSTCAQMAVTEDQTRWYSPALTVSFLPPPVYFLPGFRLLQWP